MLTTKNWGAFLRCSALAILVSLNGCAPSGPRALVDGDRLSGEGKYPQAIAKLELATQLLSEPAQTLAWNHLGLAHHRAGHPQQALAAYQQALRRNANFATARFNLGCLYLEQNDIPAAVSELTAYTVLERNAAPAAWLKLGTAQLRLRDFEMAEKSFQAALQLNAALPEAINGLGIVQLQKRRPGEALKYFHAALQRQPNYGPALLNTAIVYHQHLNNLPLAWQAYRSYLGAQPQPTDPAAVRTAIHQIELVLNPAPRSAVTNQTLVSSNDLNKAPLVAPKPAPATNPPIVQRQPPAATPTNLPSASPPEVVKNEKPVVQANSNLLANTKTPAETIRSAPAPTNAASPSLVTEKPEAPPKVEIVKITEEPPPKPAQDINPEPPAPSTNHIAAVEASDTSTTADGISGDATQDARIRVSPAKSKPTMVERLNPLTWFRGKKKAGESATPLEKKMEVSDLPPVVKGPPPQQASRPAPTNTAPATNAIPVRATPRYTYRSPAKPAPGDRRRAEPFFAQGLKAHQERRLTAAIEGYREAVKADPSFFEAHYNLGLAAYDIKDTSQSLAAYEHALAINPASLDARYNFALALARGDYLRDAASELEQLAANHAEESKVHFSLAKLYADELARPELARPHYRRVLELEPQHPQATAIRYWLAAHK